MELYITAASETCGWLCSAISRPPCLNMSGRRDKGPTSPRGFQEQKNHLYGPLHLQREFKAASK
jgi:hypothetical protein